MSGTTATQSAASGTRLEPLCHRLPEAGRLLGGVSRRKVSDLIRDDELEVTYVGEIRMVTHESIVSYLARQKEKAKQEGRQPWSAQARKASA